jgi:DNA-binding GntR family transcriptional regulator
MTQPRTRSASPLNQVVADAVRERILSGVYAAGERLAEERLSAELGVSRVPVRDALRHLAAEGLVVLRPRRGAVVVSHTPEQVQDLIEVRATLEGLNARIAARRRDPRHVGELERILRQGTRVTARSDLASIRRNNDRFHEAIEAIAANSVLVGIVRSLRDRTALLFARQSRERVRETWEEHAEIARAVLAGNADLACLLATQHVYNSARAAGVAGDAPAPRRAAVRRRAGS